MGGKTKQSQRTKNNARPSSSGRSAELLSSVKLDSGIINIAGTQLPALFPSLVAPSLDPLINPELQLCLKKLNKKDPITKTKALQELSELVTKSKVDDVVSALSSWSHFYKILTSDPDRKVRECTQACHGTIVSTCGRQIAPHLKQLMPAWLQAQYDEHAPAQTHAVNSLAKTFPDTKLPEVLSFCKEPVISQLLDVLVGDGESAHIRKTDSPEERSLQVARVVSSSLHGLQYATLHLPTPLSPWLWGELARLLQASAFWKRATNTDVRIRAAWFGAIGSIIARFKDEFGAEYGVKTLRVLVGGRELNPLAAAQLWECLLLFMHNVPNWHQYLEKKELLSKRILDVLESGGWGDARHLSNMLLPILASLPEDILTKDFYISFFNAIFNGLEKKTILSSKSERQYWITSLDECLRYLSTQSQDYVLEIVTSVHRTWLEKVLTEGPTRNHLIKYSASSMANLVKYWLKQSKDGNNEKFDQLIRNFWQNIGSTLTTQIDKLPLNNEDIEKLMDAHILLLQTLKTSFTQEMKKQHSIKFEVDNQVVEHEPIVVHHVTDPAIIERYKHNLNELVQKICGHYFEFASNKQISDPVISPLITLLVQFDNKNLYLGIAGQFSCDSVYTFYDNVLRSWLAGDTMRCKAVVTLVFMLMWHLTESEQDAVFDTFKQFPPSVVEWCLSLSLSHPTQLCNSVRRWLKSELATHAVVGLCGRLVQKGDSQARHLLLMCLDKDLNGESLVSVDAVEKSLQQLSTSLYDVDAAALEARSGVAAQLATTLPPNATLLTALLSLTTTLQRGDPRLSLDTWCEVRDAWQDGVTSLEPDARKVFLLGAAAMLHKHLNLNSNLANKSPQNPEPSSQSIDENSSEFNISKIEHIVSLCPYLLWCSSELNIPEVIRFTQTIFDIAPTDPILIESYAIRHEILTGNLNCPFEENPVIQAITNGTLTELSKDDLIAHVNTVLFRMMYLRTMFLNRPDDESDRNWCKELLSEKYFEEEFVKCVHDYSVICSLHDGYAFWPHYNLIVQSKNRLCTLLDDIISETNTEIGKSISDTLLKSMTTKGYFWAYAKTYFDSKIAKENSQPVKEISETDNTIRENDKSVSQNDTDKIQSETKCNEVTESESENTLPINLQEIMHGPTLLYNMQYLQAITKDSASEAKNIQTKYYLALGDMLIAHSAEPEVVEGLLNNMRGGMDCNPDFIVNTYYAHKHTMLYEMDISNVQWPHILSNASICSFLSSRISLHGWDSAAHNWDFTNITVCSLLTSIEMSKKNWGTTKVAVLARAVLKLFSAVSKFISAIPARCELQEPSAHVGTLPSEWSDIYSLDLHHNLFSLIVFLLESSSKTKMNSNHISILDSLIECTAQMSWERLPPAFRADKFSLKRLVGVCTTTLKEPGHSGFKYLAYHVLKMLLKPLVLEDAENLAAWSNNAMEDEEAEGSPLQLTLLYYDDAFFHLQDIVETAVSHVRVCEEVCSMVPFTDAHVLTLGWMLLADIVSQQCMLARGDLTHQYIQIYREQKYTEPLLTSALRLLPQAVLSQAADSPSHPNTSNIYKDMFTSLPELNVYKWCGPSVISALACRCVWWSVRGAGAGGARGWRGAAHHRHAMLLDNITSRYITPHVVKEEFALLQKKSSDIEDTEVTINWSSYEISCVLMVDENPIELIVTLSKQHPLVLPKLTAEHSAAGNINWILMYLGYQNGTILNALKMWTVSVNNKMEKAPQCYICYCRLHHATGRLPNVHCHTCKNKFHNVCLRKWFLSSSKMTCPLCRANF